MLLKFLLFIDCKRGGIKRNRNWNKKRKEIWSELGGFWVQLGESSENREAWESFCDMREIFKELREIFDWENLANWELYMNLLKWEAFTVKKPLE